MPATFNPIMSGPERVAADKPKDTLQQLIEMAIENGGDDLTK